MTADRIEQQSHREQGKDGQAVNQASLTGDDANRCVQHNHAAERRYDGTLDGPRLEIFNRAKGSTKNRKANREDQEWKELKATSSADSLKKLWRADNSGVTEQGQQDQCSPQD